MSCVVGLCVGLLPTVTTWNVKRSGKTSMSLKIPDPAFQVIWDKRCQDNDGYHEIETTWSSKFALWMKAKGEDKTVLTQTAHETLDNMVTGLVISCLKII